MENRCKVRSNSLKNCPLTKEKVKRLKEFFLLLSVCNRIKIICLLLQNGKMCVCELEEMLGIRQNLVSHHLSLLRKFWLVDYEKKWKSVYYFVNESKFKEFEEEIMLLIPNLK